MSQERPAYRLGAGDKLRVTVYNEPDLSGEFDVNDQGEIGLPLVGPVAVGGKSLSEVQATITQRYSTNYLVNPRVSVEVLNYRPFFIIGEVKNPGSYPYQSGMTVITGVALAGGYTPRADKGHILIKRASRAGSGEQTIGEDGAVLPGDILRVTERFF